MFLWNRSWNRLNREILAGKCLCRRGKALRVCARVWWAVTLNWSDQCGSENSQPNLRLTELLAAWVSVNLVAAGSSSDNRSNPLSREQRFWGTTDSPNFWRLIANVWLYLSFTHGKQIKTCFSHGSAKIFAAGTGNAWICSSYRWKSDTFVFSFESIFYLYILQSLEKYAFFWSQFGSSNCCHRLLLPLVWPLLFTFWTLDGA